MATNSRRIISYIIVFLLIVNLTALGTIIYKKMKCNLQAEKFHNNKGCKQNKTGNEPCFNDFMIKELKLTQEQQKQFHELKSQFQDIADVYKDSMDIQQQIIISELSNENPDFAKLKTASARSGDLYHSLKKRSIEHFLSIKSVFTPDQQKKYFEFILERNCCGKNGPKGKHCPNKKDF